MGRGSKISSSKWYICPWHLGTSLQEVVLPLVWPAWGKRTIPWIGHWNYKHSTQRNICLLGLRENTKERDCHPKQFILRGSGFWVQAAKIPVRSRCFFKQYWEIRVDTVLVNTLEVKQPWQRFHQQLKGLQKSLSHALECISENLSYTKRKIWRNKYSDGLFSESLDWSWTDWKMFFLLSTSKICIGIDSKDILNGPLDFRF